MADLVIRGGTIIDGTGAPALRGDVAIAQGRIIAVGDVPERGAREIDATGAIVTPGFVDIHTHYDGQASWDPILAPSSIQGVTSIAMGNCGVGFAPARPDKHDWLIALLEGVEDIPGTALAEGLTWDWESFPQYLDALERRSFALDLGAHVPHAALRAYVMGEAGADHAAHPDDAQLTAMARLTDEAMAAGALGFTTSRTFVHRSRDGRNIGTLTASSRELLALAQAMGARGAGVVQLISDAYLTADDDFADRELALIREMALATRRPVSFTVQQTDAAPDRWRRIFDAVAAMNREGLDVRTQVAPRPVGLILSLASTLNPFFLAPTYRAIAREGDLETRVRRLGDPEVKARILAEQSAISVDGLTQGIVSGYGRMFRLSDPVDYEPSPDRSLAAEAARAGRDPAGHVYDVLLEEAGRRLIYLPLINFAHGDLNDVHAMLTAEHVLFGLSDGGAHCGTICDASFPTTTIALWSRGNKAGRRIPLETLVHGYTQRNARHVGWHDRGVVAPGLLADLNVIDLDALDPGLPTIVHDLPAGGARLMQRARGYRHTIKSGVVTVTEGVPTGALPGRLVRGTRPAPA